MSRGRKAVSCLSPIAVIFCCLATSVAQTAKTKPIGKEELSRWINQRFDCPSDHAPYFYRLDYYDFKGDGNKEAIVVASTCETGTAGPDVHSVVARDNSGELVELKIPEPDVKAYDNLFGNRNSDLSVENGQLVSTVEDDAGRATPPLVIKYKWSGKEFEIVSIQKTGVFKTSYDCGKADSDVEKAICHVKELADLDVQLGSIYKDLLAKSSATDRASVKTEQREWIARRDKECPIYKGWVECLTDSYQKRIEELRKREAGPTGVAPHN
jgi:uncharacterized protein YecT (DUF1311 family)